MGKNDSIKRLAKLIGGMTAHRLLEEKTNRPESLNHLTSEVSNYRGGIPKIVTEYNWNSKDKIKIREESVKALNRELKKPHFSDVYVSEDDFNSFLDNTIKEFI